LKTKKHEKRQQTMVEILYNNQPQAQDELKDVGGKGNN
jgi:hypothetical protein